MSTHSLLYALLAFSMASAAAGAQAQDTQPATASTSRAADNTGINARDRSQATSTSSSQSNDKADVKLAAAVRRAITKDSSLSTQAHNIKVMTAGGTVTLRGPVPNDGEKTKLETHVRAVAGVQQVINELEVKP